MSFKFNIMKDFKVTDHFLYSELCVTKYNILNVPFDPEHIMNLRVLAGNLELIRSFVGKPIIINSAFRCKRLNDIVRGVPNSDHLIGLAADIVVPGLSFNKLFNLLHDMCNKDLLTFGQVICYNSFVYVAFNTIRHCNNFFTCFL